MPPTYASGNLSESTYYIFLPFIEGPNILTAATQERVQISLAITVIVPTPI